MKLKLGKANIIDLNYGTLGSPDDIRMMRRW